jgi:hypothetical protein
VAGGNQSAFGYRYQYLVTIERTLRFLRDRRGQLETIALHVEPTTFAREGIARDDDIVDFAIELAGEIVERDQVKGSGDPSGNKVYPKEAARAFERLDGQVASRSILLTNRPLSQGLRHKCQRVADTLDHEEWVHYAARVDGRQAAILIDHRSVDEIVVSIEELVRQFRADKDLGRSEICCRIISKLLLDEVFRSAAGGRASRFEALEIVNLIWMPDPEIAQAIGHFDWGVPISGIPVLPATVSRIALLEELFAAIGRAPHAPTPNLAVAVGQTGYGKSALAADFCHLNRNSYGFLCWIDCSDLLLIESRIRHVTEELVRTPLPQDANPSGRFRQALATHAGPWLIVFDGVSSRTDIEDFVPTQGNGSVLITSTNETGWWPTSTVLSVGVFTDAEAAACFESYAGLDAAAAATAAPAITDISSRLGRIPLAVSMAGLYFRNASGTVGELSGSYFAELDALDDIGAIPPGFDRTAFAAIEHAVRHLGAGLTGIDRHDARLVENLLYRASLLAPDLVPLNYLIASMPETINVRLGHLPEPAFADSALRRRYTSIMRTQSIAHRALLLDEEGEQNESSETIEIHPLVHEILRRLFLRQIPPINLSEQLTVMTHFLHGWIVCARMRRQYFVVDQLVAHADSLLKVMDDLGELTAASAKHAEMLRFTKISLALEVATCRMGRGNVFESVNYAREALIELWTTLPPSSPRDALALIAATSIVVDLSEAGTDGAVMRPWARHALTALLNCESLGPNGAAAAYERAYLVQASLNQRLTYSQDAEIANVLSALQDMIARDPSDELRPNEVMTQLIAHMDSGELDSADASLETLRAAQNDYDRHLLDCLEVNIFLRRHDFVRALPAIEALIARQLYETYGARPLSRGLTGIHRTLEIVISDGIGPIEHLQVLSMRAHARAQELHQEIALQ